MMIYISEQPKMISFIFVNVEPSPVVKLELNQLKN